MFDDRRRHPRYPVLLAGEARPAGGQAFRVVCTSVSRTGAYFACSVEVSPGTELLATLRPSASSGVELSCRVEAVRQNRRGGAESPGFGARWHSLVCKQGPAPLWHFVTEQLHWHDAPRPEVDPSGLARYDVNSDGVWIGAAPAVEQSAVGFRDADTVVGGVGTLTATGLPPSALSKVLELEILGTRAADISVPTTRDSARFSTHGDFWDDERTLASPTPLADGAGPAWSAPGSPAVAPQAPLALFAGRRRDPSQPYEPLDVGPPVAAPAPQDGTATLRELPPFAPAAPKAKIMPVASGEFPVATDGNGDKTQP